MTVTLTDEQRNRLAPAFHEAGHAVVGVLHGATVGRAELVRGGPRTNPDGTFGVCRYESFDFIAEARRRDIAAAGTIAEAVVRFGPEPTPRQIDQVLARNSNDRAELRRLCFAAGEPVSVPTAEVLPLVTRCWPSLAELAHRLVKDGEFGHSDVLAALSIPAGASADVVARYASAIRNGSIPGTFTITPAVGRK